MIYTVTLNPALDRAINVDSLVQDDTVRVLSENHYAAGKGIDVSRVIRELGGESVALGLIGGYDGMHLEGLLINAGVMSQFTKISNETRTNIILKENRTGKQYVISASGPQVTATEIGQFYNHIVEIMDMNYLVMSGSLPRGVTPNIYGQLILAGRKKGAFIFLDADGKALKESISYVPTGIKPNIHELSRLTGRELREDSEIIDACVPLHEMGIKMVLVSRGKSGLLLSMDDKKIKAAAPPVDVESTVGAGDSTVAGFILAHSRGLDIIECLRMACAAGTATAQTPGTELCHSEDVEKLLPVVEMTVL
jgi:6-phosphofructokinase 2